jgi:MAF protein
MLVLASASPRRRELLTQAGFSFEIYPAHIPEDPYPNEAPLAYVLRLAREKAQAVYRELTHAPESPASGSDLYQDTNSVVPHMLQEDAGGLQATEKGWFTAQMPEKRSSGAKAIADSIGLTRGLKPPSASASSFSAACLAQERVFSESLTVLGADTTVTLDNQILGKPEDAADAARILRLLSGRTHCVITGVAVVTASRTEVAAESTAVRFLALSDEEIADYVATGEPMDKAGAYAIQGSAARWIPRIEGCYFNVVGLPIALVASLLESRQPR